MIVSEPYFSELERAEEVKSPNPSLPMAKLTAFGWILQGAFGVSRQLITTSAFSVHTNEQETFDLQTIYKLLSFDFAKFWSGENVGISKTKAKPTKLTALEIRAEEHHRKTSKFNIKKKKWTVQLPWIDPELESHRLTDNLKRVMYRTRDEYDTKNRQHVCLIRDLFID